MLIYWVGFFMWLGAAFIAGLLIGQRNSNAKVGPPSESHNKKSDAMSALAHLEKTADFLGKNYDYGFELSIRKDAQTLRTFF